MTRTMRRDGLPTPARFSAALRELRRAAAAELRELRSRPAIRAAMRVAPSCGDWKRNRALSRLAVRRCDCAQWALGVLCWVMGEGPTWAPPVAPGARQRAARALVERARRRDAEAYAWPCGVQDSMGERSVADFRLADYLAAYNVTGG